MLPAITTRLRQKREHSNVRSSTRPHLSHQHQRLRGTVRAPVHTRRHIRRRHRHGVRQPLSIHCHRARRSSRTHTHQFATSRVLTRAATGEEATLPIDTHLYIEFSHPLTNFFQVSQYGSDNRLISHRNQYNFQYCIYLNDF